MARDAFFVAIAAFASCCLASAPTRAQLAYITNSRSNTVSVIDTNTRNNDVIATIPLDRLGENPTGVAVAPDSKKVYVTNSKGFLEIDTATNKVVRATDIDASEAVAVIPDGPARGRVYLPDFGHAEVSVIDTSPPPSSPVTLITKSPIRVGVNPYGIAATPDGKKVYVANEGSSSVSVIDTATNKVTKTITVGTRPIGVAVTPNSQRVYVTNAFEPGMNGGVSVIDTTTDKVVETITDRIGREPWGVAASPDGSKVWVAQRGENNVLGILTATNTLGPAPSTNGRRPTGVAVTPDGRVYVANLDSTDVAVIDSMANTVSNVEVGRGPFAFGMFITPARVPVTSSPSFAGRPGFSNCVGQSSAGLDQQFGGRNAAAAALGFSDAPALENAVLEFCH